MGATPHTQPFFFGWKDIVDKKNRMTHKIGINIGIMFFCKLMIRRFMIFDNNPNSNTDRLVKKNTIIKCTMRAMNIEQINENSIHLVFKY